MKPILLVLVGTALAVMPTPSRADATQVWTGFESRVPVSDGAYGLPHDARVVAEARFGGQREELSLMLARAGPMWSLHPNVGLNLNGVQALSPDSGSGFRRESRVEIEPNLRLPAGPLHANVRQRVDFRWIAAELAPRYRLQLRLNYQPKEARIVPFVSGEAHVITKLRVSEVRALAGLSVVVSSHLRIDLAYMWRPARREDDWFVTHAAILNLIFTPRVAPVFESGL